MTADLPAELTFLANGVGPAAREDGWSRFVNQYTPLLMRATRQFGGDYDARMDRYRHVLDALREDDFRRLRAFKPVAGSSVAAWLVVVARRLCLDHERNRSGRPRNEASDDGVASQRRLRRALGTLGAGVFDPGDRLPSKSPGPEETMRQEELLHALATAVRRLTPRQQLVIRLRFDDGRSIDEIGEVLGTRNVFQVYRLLKSSLADIRRHLAQSGVMDAEP